MTLVSHAPVRRLMVVSSAAIAGFWIELQRFPPAPPQEAPPSELWQRGTPTVKFGADNYREVACRTLEKQVSFEWRHATSALPSNTNVKASDSQVFSTDYWPTFALPAGKYGLCVAGKTVNGDAILEYWKFGATSSAGGFAPAVCPAPRQGEGASTFVWTLPPRNAVEAVVRAPASSKQGLVRGLFPSLASTSKVYAYFETSRTMVLVDLVAMTQTVQATPLVGTPNAVSAPALTNHYQRFWAADYTQRGFCYLFAPVNAASGATALPDFLALIDTNRDGTIDAMSVITGAAWKEDGWGDPANIAPPRD